MSLFKGCYCSREGYKMTLESDAEVELRHILRSPMEEEEKKGCCRARMIEYHDYRTLMGPCLISFSIPLLIPGVVLTIVGSYGNEHTFPTFGGWHITGIVILTISVSLLVVGIVFKCCFRPYLSPDVAQHLTPRQSIVSGHQNLGFESEKGPEGKRIYKGSEKDDLNTQINSKLHRVVSTHEIREKDPRQGVAANGTIAQTLDEQRQYSNKHKQSNKVSHKDSFGENDKAIKEEVEEIQDDHHREKRKKKHRSKKSSITEETNEDGVTTTVTSTVHAEADSHVVLSSDHERNPSSQDHEQKIKRRRKKKKRRHLKERQDDAHLTLSDGETTTITAIPDVRVRTSQIPPNVPYHTEAELDIRTPRPIQETQHIPFHVKTDLDLRDSGLDKTSEHYRFTTLPRDDPNTLLPVHLSQDSENQRAIDSDSNLNPVEFSNPTHFSQRTDRGASEHTQESSDFYLFQRNTCMNVSQETRPGHESHHSQFLKKRGIGTFESNDLLNRETERDLNMDPQLSAEHDHHVHFENVIDREPNIPSLPQPYSHKQAGDDADVKQPYSENYHANTGYLGHEYSAYSAGSGADHVHGRNDSDLQ